MLTYICRQELAPVLSVDPVLHAYPLLACYQEPQAPVSAWKDSNGAILGALVPCDPPGVAWIVAASGQIVRALLEEVPPDFAITMPLWADTVVKECCPGRKLSTEAIAVCTAGSFRPQPPRRGSTFRHIDAVPGADTMAVAIAPVRIGHLGCFFGDNLAGFCTYRVDGAGGATVERLVITEGWTGADLGQTLLAAASALMLEDAERLVFLASGDNQASLGVARTVGFRTCYWLRSASPEGQEHSP